MSLDMVRMPIAAVLVVGHDDIRVQCPDLSGHHGYGFPRLGSDEGVRMLRTRSAGHTRVAVTRGNAPLRILSQHRVPYPQYRHGRPELCPAPASEGVVTIGAEVGQRRRDHLALLAQ